jgi:hypothetical protein
MALFKVNVKSSQPAIGYLIIDMPTAGEAEAFVTERLADEDVRRVMVDHLLYDCEWDPPKVVGSEPTTGEAMNEGGTFTGYGDCHA